MDAQLLYLLGCKNFSWRQPDARTIKIIKSGDGFIVFSDAQIISTIPETELCSGGEGVGLFMKPSGKSKLAPYAPEIVKTKIERPDGTEFLQNFNPLFWIRIGDK